MRIAEYYSHFNGLEFLLINKPELWQEIETAITSVDINGCKTKISNINNINEKQVFNSVEINHALELILRKMEWKDSSAYFSEANYDKSFSNNHQLPFEKQTSEISETNETPIYCYNQTDFIKDRVAVEVQFGKYSFVAYDLFVKHLAFYVGDFIDVGIEILPTKALQKEMSSGVSYYEGEFYNVVRQGRGVPAVPLVLIGIEP